MRTIETKIYRFEELSDLAKENAIDMLRFINTNDTDWWQCSFDTWREIGVQINSFDLFKEKIEIDLFYSHEDVAQRIVSSFGHNESYDFAKEYLELKKKLDKTYENEFDEWGECAEYDDELDDANALFYADLENAIIWWLRLEMDYLESDDAIIDTIEANEYEFTEIGERY